MRKTKDILIFVFAFAVIAAMAYVIFLFFHVQNKYSESPENIAMVLEPRLESNITYDDEHNIISNMLDSIYKVDYCHPIRKIPKKADSVLIDRMEKRYLVSERDRDTIKKFVTIPDSLTSLNIENNRGYILKYLDTLSNEFNFIKNLKTELNSKKLKTELIEQDGIEFLTKFSARKRGFNPLSYGKKDTILNIGFMGFSRVVFSEKYNTGIFHYTYLGDPNCGYTCYVIFYKENSKWIYRKAIHTGAF
ncbi:hypothetical protein [Aureibaculum conchae]|uniref:hypothetical protein n=1 Tax=Aureibaculum sp. 2308TA14-22 TaxID=3108392 RepID=UPI003396701D